MSLKILVAAAVVFPAITTALKYTNESRRSIDNVYNQCWDVVKDYPAPTFEMANNLMTSFEVYTHRLGDLANYENSTTLSSSAVMMLNTLGLLETLKDTPQNLLIQFQKILPKVSLGLRQIVSMQQCNIGKLTDYINDDIKCLERSVMRLLTDFLRNGIGNLSLGKKTDFEPVMKCLQNLTNKIAQISERALNDASLSTESVDKSILMLAMVLSHSYVFVQGTTSTIDAIIHTERKETPATLNACLHAVDGLIVPLTKSIQSITEVCAFTLRTLLRSLVSLNDFLNATLKSVFGLTAGAILTVQKITDGLLSGVSSITQGLNKLG